MRTVLDGAAPVHTIISMDFSTWSSEERVDIPQSALPASKITSASTNDHLNGKFLYIFPQKDWKDARVRKYADPYQPTSWRLPNVFVILGMAVETMVCNDHQSL